MSELVDLGRATRAVLRRWPMVVLVSAVFAGGAYAVSKQMTPVYEGTASVIVGQTADGLGPDSKAIDASEQLATTYADLARRQPVLQGVAESLGNGIAWTDLRRRISAHQVADTPLLTITATATSPDEAQTIAGAVAERLVDLASAESDVDRQDFLSGRLQVLQASIERGQVELEELQKTLAAAVRAGQAEQVQQLEAEVAAQQDAIVSSQQAYASLLQLLRAERTSTPLQLLEPAQANTDPVRPQTRLNIAIGAMAGLLVAAALAYMLDVRASARRAKARRAATHRASLPSAAPVVDAAVAGSESPPNAAVESPAAQEPAPSEQPSVQESPARIGTPAESSEPPSVQEPPARIGAPAESTGPRADGSEPVAESGEPPAAQEPAESGEPPAAQEPAESSEPPAAQEPAESGEPPAAQEPAESSEPPAAQEPAESSEPPAAQEPAESSEPPLVQEPPARIGTPAERSEPPAAQEPAESSEPVAESSEPPAAQEPPGTGAVPLGPTRATTEPHPAAPGRRLSVAAHVRTASRPPSPQGPPQPPSNGARATPAPRGDAGHDIADARARPDAASTERARLVRPDAREPGERRSLWVPTSAPGGDEPDGERAPRVADPAQNVLETDERYTGDREQT